MPRQRQWQWPEAGGSRRGTCCGTIGFARHDLSQLGWACLLGSVASWEGLRKCSAVRHVTQIFAWLWQGSITRCLMLDSNILLKSICQKHTYPMLYVCICRQLDRQHANWKETNFKYLNIIDIWCSYRSGIDIRFVGAGNQLDHILVPMLGSPV